MQELRKNREIQLNQQTIRCQVLADMIKIWSCLMFIKLYRKSTNLLLKSRIVLKKSVKYENRKQPSPPCIMFWWNELRNISTKPIFAFMRVAQVRLEKTI